MVRALSVILSILLASMGIGIWSGISEPGSTVPALRRRWLFLFMAYVLATVYAGGWGFLGEGASRAMSQGVGLAVLGALPMYAGGALLGVMAQEASRRTGRGAAPFALAALGAGAGSLFVGLFAGARIIPPSFLLLCLVVLSGASFVEAVGLAALEEGREAELPGEGEEGQKPEEVKEPEEDEDREGGSGGRGSGGCGMILAHLADIHLGFSGYDRTVQGRNVRTRDVEEAFQDALGQVVALRPDLVISGRRSPRSSPSRFRCPGCPDRWVGSASGGASRRSSPGGGGGSGIRRCSGSIPESWRPWIDYPVCGGCGLCSPVHFPTSTGDPRTPSSPPVDPGNSPTPPSAQKPSPLTTSRCFTGGPSQSRGWAVVPEGWSYIALGSGHHFRQFEGPVVDPGSIERVSVDPWSEALEEKGFVTFEIGCFGGGLPPRGGSACSRFGTGSVRSGEA